MRSAVGIGLLTIERCTIRDRDDLNGGNIQSQ